MLLKLTLKENFRDHHIIQFLLSFIFVVKSLTINNYQNNFYIFNPF